MTPEIIFGVCAIVLTIIGLVFKSISEMRQEIQATTTFHVRTEEKLNMVNHRLTAIETGMSKLEATMDDLTRYMSNNSDWHTRKHG